MNAEETEIYEFLKGRAGNFVSVNEISRAVGRGRRFQQDRSWARPVLRRMELDGLVEANPYGEYRVNAPEATDAEAPNGSGATDPEVTTEPVDFREALQNPGVSLGDTTIIRIQDT